MSLELYLDNRWIRRHESSVVEITNLLAIADRDIRESQTPGLGPEWRFDIAYNSALQSATAALASAGYRAERQNKHLRTIECLQFTVGLTEKEVAFLDACRRKRHTAVYDQMGAISDLEADEMVQRAISLRQQVEAWIRRTHPELLPK
jgi:hypothetical protein